VRGASCTRFVKCKMTVDGFFFLGNMSIYFLSERLFKNLEVRCKVRKSIYLPAENISQNLEFELNLNVLCRITRVKSATPRKREKVYGVATVSRIAEMIGLFCRI